MLSSNQKLIVVLFSAAVNAPRPGVESTLHVRERLVVLQSLLTAWNMSCDDCSISRVAMISS